MFGWRLMGWLSGFCVRCLLKNAAGIKHILLIASFLGAMGLQRGGEVGDEVVDVLDADAEAEHVRVYSCGNLLLRAEL